MVNQIGKFIPRLAEINKPLRQLLCKDTAWLWEVSQETAFQQVKDMLVSPEIIAHYDPDRPTVIAADASSEGIGAVLLQIQDDSRRRPVCYASRSLTDTEKRYAVIEKEALAATWACEKFREYVMGLSFTLETDHKPLVPLLKSTELAKMPPRIQRFRMRLMRYSPEVAYVPGKQQTTPDALSRAPVNIPEKTDVMFLEEVEHYATTTVTVLPATENVYRTFPRHRKTTTYAQRCGDIAMKAGLHSCRKFRYCVHTGRAEAISLLSTTYCSTTSA